MTINIDNFVPACLAFVITTFLDLLLCSCTWVFGSDEHREFSADILTYKSINEV